MGAGDSVSRRQPDQPVDCAKSIELPDRSHQFRPLAGAVAGRDQESPDLTGSEYADHALLSREQIATRASGSDRDVGRPFEAEARSCSAQRQSHDHRNGTRVGQGHHGAARREVRLDLQHEGIAGTVAGVDPMDGEHNQRRDQGGEAGAEDEHLRASGGPRAPDAARRSLPPVASGGGAGAISARGRPAPAAARAGAGEEPPARSA